MRDYSLRARASVTVIPAPAGLKVWHVCHPDENTKSPEELVSGPHLVLALAIESSSVEGPVGCAVSTALGPFLTTGGLECEGWMEAAYRTASPESGDTYFLLHCGWDDPWVNRMATEVSQALASARAKEKFRLRFPEGRS